MWSCICIKHNDYKQSVWIVLLSVAYLYYAYGMVKRIAYKKRVIIVSTVIVGVLLAGGVGYFLYSKQQSTSGEKNKDENSTAYLAEGQMEFSQQDYLNLNAEFKKLITAGERDKAFQLLSSRYKTETNLDKKIKMIMHESSILGQNGFADEALDAAFRADKLRSSTATLMQIAAAYAAKKDTHKQVEYIKKAMDSLDTNSYIDPEQKAEVKAGYQSLIDDIESGGNQ